MNVRDFPESALAPHGVIAVHPDGFPSGLYDADPELVRASTEMAHANLSRSAPSFADYLGARDAVDSQFTRAIDEFAGRFEHRLFFSATPHNGHPNSFSRLLAMLDPQRFTRGVPVVPSDLDPIKVRRLKADLRLLGEQFPERVVKAIHLKGLRPDVPELVLAEQRFVEPKMTYGMRL